MVTKETSGKDGEHPNIVLVVTDSARVDRFIKSHESRTQTPIFDELARQGIFFENAYSTGSWTVPAHGSLFTGKLPSEHGAHARQKSLDAKYGETLAGRLSSIGYDSVGFSSNPWISGQFGFDAGFDEFHEVLPELPFDDPDPREHLNEPTVKEIIKWIISGNPYKRIINGVYAKFFQSFPYAPADAMTDEINEWIQRSQSTPFFVFANYMDPHEPYLIREGGIDEEVLDFEWNLHSYENPPEPEAYGDIRAIYDSSISYLDEHIGRLVGNLDLDNTLIIIVGDHGQSLGEDGYWGHGTHLSEELLHVPLITVTPDDDSCIPPDSVVSIRDIPSLIFNYLGLSWEDDITPLRERLDGIRIAESFGPHQDVTPLPSSISDSGYRAIIQEDGFLLRKLDDGDVEFISSTDRAGKDEIPPELLEKEKEVADNLTTVEENSNNKVSNAVQNRLQDLGYM